MAQPVVEEGKLLSEAISTVKIQVQQMKRHLVSLYFRILLASLLTFHSGIGPTHGRSKECELDAC